MLKLMHNDKMLKEYEDSAIFLIFNGNTAELIGSNEFINTSEQAANLHAALAFHWMLANDPELVAKVLEAFDNHVAEEAKPATETVQ